MRLPELVSQTRTIHPVEYAGGTVHRVALTLSNGRVLWFYEATMQTGMVVPCDSLGEARALLLGCKR